MRIGNNGNVVIGTTDTATYKLNVNGNINATSSLTTSGLIIPNTTTSAIDVFTMQYDTTNSIRFRQ